MAQALLENLPEQTFTSATIKRMYRLVDRAKTDDVFQKLVYGLVNHSMKGRWKDYKGELNTVYGWFRKNVDYRRDPHGVELLQDVWATIDRKRGDCDDATVWLCAAAEILGCPCRIVTVSTRRDLEPNHVYPEAFVSGRWLGMDATVPGAYVGWQPPHITAKRIWRRKDVGLSGDSDDVIEGLGMSHENGYGGNGFSTDMRPVSGRLAPGIPDDISKTWASPAPGTTLTSGRALRYAPIANLSDRTSNPRPGGGVFQPALPIESMPTPRELWSLVDRKLMPRVLDPYCAWWGKMPTSKEELHRMFPGSQAQEENYLMDIASVPASAIAEISNDIGQQLQLGEIGQDEVENAIGEAMEDFALGQLPRMKRPQHQRLSRAERLARWKKKHPGKALPPGLAKRPGEPAYPRPLHERRYMVEGPKTNLVSNRRMAGLGSLFDDIVKTATDFVKTGTAPTIDQAVQLATGAAPPAPKPTVTASTVAKAGIPIGMIVLLGGAAWLMTRGGGRKYRSNPSRRRSRGRGRRGGSFLQKNKTMLLVGAAGAAAWFLFLRPGATFLPSVPRTTTVVKTPTISTSQAMTAAAIKSAPSILDSISKFFAPSSPITTTYSTEGAQPVPGIVTSYS